MSKYEKKTASKCAVHAGYLAQCGMQPELSHILRELFDVSECRISLRHRLAYMKVGETVSFGELAERARINRETIVGYVNQHRSSIVVTNRDQTVKADDVRSLVVLTGKKTSSAI